MSAAEDAGLPHRPRPDCGTAGVQLATGVTRLMIGSSVNAAFAPGISVSAGINQLLAPAQRPRWSLGLAFGS